MINRRAFLKVASVSAFVASTPILKAKALAATEAASVVTIAAPASDEFGCGGGYGIGDYGFGEYSVSQTQDLITPAVRIGAEDNSVMLSWNEVEGTTLYEVWRSDDPYFNLGDESGKLMATVEAASYVDNDVVSDGSEAYFYLVRGVNNCAQSSDTSNRTGGFSFQIQTSG